MVYERSRQAYQLGSELSQEEASGVAARKGPPPGAKDNPKRLTSVGVTQMVNGSSKYDDQQSWKAKKPTGANVYLKKQRVTERRVS